MSLRPPETLEEFRQLVLHETGMRLITPPMGMTEVCSYCGEPFGCSYVAPHFCDDPCYDLWPRNIACALSFDLGVKEAERDRAVAVERERSGALVLKAWEALSNSAKLHRWAFHEKCLGHTLGYNLHHQVTTGKNRWDP